MHLTDHVTDVQLNEYLDNESTKRAQIESHLAECVECTARLTALKSLFAEIESLPELELTRSLAAPFISDPSLSPQLARWLTLTATLQTAVALVALIFAAPLIVNLLPSVKTPSLTETLVQVQAQWIGWFSTLFTFQLPSFPQLPLFEIPSLMLTISLAIVSTLWLVGNGLLLRRR